MSDEEHRWQFIRVSIEAKDTVRIISLLYCSDIYKKLKIKKFKDHRKKKITDASQKTVADNMFRFP